MLMFVHPQLLLSQADGEVRRADALNVSRAPIVSARRFGRRGSFRTCACCLGYHPRCEATPDSTLGRFEALAGRDQPEPAHPPHIERMSFGSASPRRPAISFATS